MKHDRELEAYFSRVRRHDVEVMLCKDPLRCDSFSLALDWP